LLASGMQLPDKGNVFLSLSDHDKPHGVVIASKLIELGLKVYCTKGTYEYLRNEGVGVEYVKKVSEGRPNILDKMKNNNIQFLINTPSGKRSRNDSFFIRRTALTMNIPYCTTLSGAIAATRAIEAKKMGKIMNVVSIQEYYQKRG